MSSFNLDQRGMATLYMPTFYTPPGIGFMCCSLFSPLIMIYVPHDSQIQVVFHSLVPFGFQIHIIVHTFILKKQQLHVYAFAKSRVWIQAHYCTCVESYGYKLPHNANTTKHHFNFTYHPRTNLTHISTCTQ